MEDKQKSEVDTRTAPYPILLYLLTGPLLSRHVTITETTLCVDLICSSHRNNNVTLSSPPARPCRSIVSPCPPVFSGDTPTHSVQPRPLLSLILLSFFFLRAASLPDAFGAYRSMLLATWIWVPLLTCTHPFLPSSPSFVSISLVPSPHPTLHRIISMFSCQEMHLCRVIVCYVLASARLVSITVVIHLQTDCKNEQQP